MQFLLYISLNEFLDLYIDEYMCSVVNVICLNKSQFIVHFFNNELSSIISFKCFHHSLNNTILIILIFNTYRKNV